jgi:hypothetical protein
MAWVGASAAIAARPQIFSFALVLVFTVVGLRTAEDLRPRWWLVPLTWVWACSHGMWLIGVLISVTVLLGVVLQRTARPREILRLSLVPVLGVAVACLTPIGPRLLTAPLHVEGYAQYVMEWQPPALRDYYVAATLTMAATCVMLWSRSSARIPWPRLLLLLTAVGWTLLYARTVAIGAVMLAPLFAETVQRHLPRREGNLKVEVGGLVAACSIAITMAFGIAPVRADGTGMVPDAFDTRLSELPQGAVVYNSYELGGWLLLNYPQVAPVIDPRTEVFGVPYVERYIASVKAQPGWRETVGEAGARVALLPLSSSLAGELVQEGWRQEATHRGYAYLVAP